MSMFIVNESGSGYNRGIKRGKRMYTDDYMTYLKKEKRMSENTRAAYGRDLAEFVAFEGARGMTDLLGVTSTETSVVFSLSDPCGDDGIRSDGEHQVAKDRAENH